jgi:hypothetical protein
MKKKLLLIGLLGLMTLSSCGIFHKGCGCPHFGRVNNNVQMCGYANVQMC